MEDLLRLLRLQDVNTWIVLIGTGLLGLSSGIIGSFAVLRRQALVGDAVAHAALPGICVAYLLFRDASFPLFLLGALVSGVLGVLCVSFVRSQTRIKEDAAIGLMLSVLFGLGMVLLRRIQSDPQGSRAGLSTFLYGKAAGMTWPDVMLIASAGAVVVVVVAALFKEFRVLSFDRQFAATLGWPVFRLDVLMMFLLCVCTVAGLPAVGVVLMAALLIIPGAAARFWTDHLGWMLILAGGVGMLSCAVGTGISANVGNLPAGPTIVLVAAGVFVLSMLSAPRRGLLAEGMRRWSMRRRYAMQNLLRAMWEAGEATGDLSARVTLGELLQSRSWSAGALTRHLRRAAARRWVRPDADAYRLTPAGVEEAARIARAHRLWEAFLLEDAAVAPEYAHRYADQIEHVLPPDVLNRLEVRLQAQGRIPVPGDVNRRKGGAPA